MKKLTNVDLYAWPKVGEIIANGATLVLVGKITPANKDWGSLAWRKVLAVRTAEHASYVVWSEIADEDGSFRTSGGAYFPELDQAIKIFKEGQVLTSPKEGV